MIHLNLSLKANHSCSNTVYCVGGISLNQLRSSQSTSFFLSLTRMLCQEFAQLKHNFFFYIRSAATTATDQDTLLQLFAPFD